MATTNIAWGLKGLSFAPVGKITSATWDSVGNVLEGSISLNFEAPTANHVKVEEVDAPIFTKYEEGAKSVELDIADVSKETIEKLFGVTASGNQLSIPDKTKPLNKMVKFEFQEGGSLYFTNASIVASFGGSMTKTGSDIFNVHLTMSVNAGLGGSTYEGSGIVLEVA
ncbi:MAG: hypothetical protein ACLVKO_06955 [Dysgonomonas sp.]